MSTVPNIITESKTRPTKAEREAQVRASYFLPYQWAWINDEARNKICEKSRRVGLTFAEEYRRVRRLATSGARYDAWISSRDESLAKLFIQECKVFAQTLNVAAQDMGEIALDKEKGVSAFAMSFATGRTLYSLSSNPDAQAGRKGDRTLDEYALSKDQRKLFAITKPGLKWGGQLSIFSTHRGSASYFNVLLREIVEKGNPKKFSHHRITIEDAVKQGLWLKIQSLLPDDDEQKGWSEDDFLQDCRDEMPDEESFLQEYMCVPADDASAFLPWDLIVGCSIPRPADLPAWKSTLAGCPLYIGVDVGRKKDLTVLWVLALVNGRLVTYDVVEIKGMPFDQQKQRLYEWLRNPMVRRCCIDATGLGMHLAEDAQRDFGRRVSPITFTAAVKQELAYPLKARFEDRKIDVWDDRLHHADLRGVKIETTKSGNLVFTTEAGATDGHADRFWALALSVHGAEIQTNPGTFTRLRAFMSSSSRAQARRQRTLE